MMKWWGWGDPKRVFPLANKPLLWPWVEKKLPNAAIRFSKVFSVEV